MTIILVKKKRKFGYGDRHIQRENNGKTWGEDSHLHATDHLRPPEARKEIWNKSSLVDLRRNQPY